MPFKMHKIIFFSGKKEQKKGVPTLPKIFRTVTRNTLMAFRCRVDGSSIYAYMWSIIDMPKKAVQMAQPFFYLA